MLEWLLSLFRKKPQPQPPPPTPRATIAVVVTNQRTGDPLVAATFRLNETLRTVTDQNGYAAIEVEQGEVHYAVEHPDFYAVHAKILLTRNTQLAVAIEPIKLPVVYPRIQGQLRVDGAQFVDDGGLVLPLFAHAGDLFSLYVRHEEQALGEIQKIADAGYQGFRVWTVLRGPYWEQKNRDVTPTGSVGYWDKWELFCRAVDRAELKLVVSQGDMNAWTDKLDRRVEFAQQLAKVERLVGNGIYAFLDGGNESWQNGENDPARLAQFVSAYRAAGGRAVLTLTSPPGEEKHELDAFSINPADCYDVHGYRGGRAYDKIRHIFSIPYEGKPARKLGIQSEPAGSGELVSVTDNKDELDHEAVALMGVMSLIARQAWVWFSGEGVMIRAGIETENGFVATPKLAALLPRDVMSFGTFHHSGDSWKNIRLVDQGVTHESRVDGAQHADGRCVYLFYGEPGTHTFRAARNFEGELIHPGTGETQALSVKKGETFSVAWQWGRLFVGKLT